MVTNNHQLESRNVCRLCKSRSSRVKWHRGHRRRYQASIGRLKKAVDSFIIVAYENLVKRRSSYDNGSLCDDEQDDSSFEELDPISRMNRELNLSGLRSCLDSSRSSPSDNARFSTPSPMSASCSFMDSPVQRAKMFEGLDKSLDSVSGNRSINDSSGKPADEFWAALQSHYNYLMDDELIISCKEANGEMSWDDEEIDDENVSWSFTEFIEQFDKLTTWLDSLQKSVSEDGLQTSQSILQSEDLKNKICLRTVFNNQSKKLGKRYPTMKDEILNRVIVLNNKWDALEQVITPDNQVTEHDNLLKDVISKLNCLRRWLHLLETKIQPLVLHPEWNLANLEEKQNENTNIQKEIESYGKLISSVVKSFDRLCADEEKGKEVPEQKTESVAPTEQPTSSRCRCRHVKRAAKHLEHRLHYIWLRSLEWRYLIEELITKSKAGFVASDSNLELSFGLDEPLTKVPRLGAFNIGDSLLALDTSSRSFVNEPPTIDSENGDNVNGADKADGVTNNASMIGTSKKVSKEGACNILKIEMVHDVGYSSESSAYLSNECAELSYSYVPGKMTIEPIKEDVAGENKPEPVGFSTPKMKGSKGEMIKEWLKNQNVDAKMYSSCDASGEYTSNDDAESSESSDDLNNSVVTYRQRQSSIPNDDRVVMRKKKRRGGRPWSVTELYQMSNQLDLSPFSVSMNDINLSSTSLGDDRSNATLMSTSVEMKKSDKSDDLSSRKKSRARRRKTGSSSEGISVQFSGPGSDSNNKDSPIRRSSRASRTSRSSGHKTSSTEKSFSDLCSNAVLSNDDEGASEEILSKFQNFDVAMQTDEAGNFSDQVWDGYQDPPYLSEACSEFAVDDNTLKKLIEFGDDYRAFIGPQSDTVSILSNCSDKDKMYPIQSKYKTSKKPEFNEDSDSDMEDLKHIIKDSVGQLEFSESTLRKHRDGQAMGYFQPPLDYAELEATCRTNIKCLQVIKSHLDDCTTTNLSESGLQSVQGLLDRWCVLNSETSSTRTQDEAVLNLSSCIKKCSNQLDLISTSIFVKSITDFDHLCLWIDKHRVAASLLHELKSDLFDLQNTLESCGNLAHNIKKETSSLEGYFEDLDLRCKNQLGELEKTKSRWQSFVKQYDRLSSRLNRLKSPKSKQRDLANSMEEIEEELSWLKRHVSQESLSSDCDSGIGLWDGASNLLHDVQKQIEHMKEATVVKDDVAMTTRLTKEEAKLTAKPQDLKSMVKRALKYALPFHLAVVLMCCLAWLLEPQCCDSNNSYRISMDLLKFYKQGPPPT